MARQALIQIYGSAELVLPISKIAERLDITPAFASSLVKMLVAKRYVERRRNEEDRRSMVIEVTELGERVLHEIDDRVQVHVDYFNHQLEQSQREAALAISNVLCGCFFKGLLENRLTCLLGKRRRCGGNLVTTPQASFDNKPRQQ